MNDPKKDKLTLWLESLRKYKLLKPLIDLFFKYREIIMYLIFGVLTTAVDFLVYFPLYNIFHVHYLIANLAAWIAAVIFAYITNKLWVFDSKSFDKKTVLKEFVIFAGGRVVSFLVQEALLFLLVDLLHVNANISKIGVSVIVIILNYIISKLFVFKKNKNADGNK